VKENLSLIGERKPDFFYGYIIVITLFCVQMLAWGIFTTFGVFFNPLLNEFGWTRAMISGASSLCFILFGFVGIIAGRLGDKIGPRIVMTSCGVFLGLGYLLMSQVNAIWQLYLFYGVILGIGLSGMDVIPLSTVARWFVRRRGTMSGIIKVGAGVGILIMLPLASWLISSYGWRTSYVVIGITVLAVIIPAAQFLRRDPRQMGQLPNGDKKASSEHLNSEEGGFSFKEAIHTRQFWMTCAIYFTTIFCAQAILVHIVPHAIELGISAANAANILAVVGGVSILGRTVLGGVADKIGYKLAMTICFLVLVLAFCWLQLARELWMLYLFAIIYGFAHGGFFTLTSPLVAGLFGLSSHGVIFGTVGFGGTIGGAIGGVLSGYIFDITGSYQLAFLVCVALGVTGLILTLLLKPTTKVGAPITSV